MKLRKVAETTKECVACGNCKNYCPGQAITLDRGIQAKVNEGKCRGCGKCVAACPAGVIALREREVAHA